MKGRSPQRGVVTLELALWLPVMLLMVVGLLTLGAALQHKARLDDAAVAGLRWAAQGGAMAWDLAGIESAVRANLGAPPAPVSVTIQHVCHCPNATGTALLEVSCQTGICLDNGLDPQVFTYVWIAVQTDVSLAPWLGLPTPLTLQTRQGLRVR